MTLQLFHYYEFERGPFKNLSSLSDKQAEQVMKEIKDKGEIFASQRPADYLIIRRELENKAREIFMSKGGEPANPYPHYMTLGPCYWIKQWYKQGAEIQIPFDEFDEKSVSFTYGDLFPTMRYVDGKPYRKQVYTKVEILRLIDEYGFPQVWNEDGSKGPERYIEVQVWDEKVIMNYLSI
ncbi:hypothetical protein MO973_04280 [Paenibacillus sp. TRM 82003]|nr:hypothetical protein [Paenibacillus sp. TRM 82003]